MALKTITVDVEIPDEKLDIAKDRLKNYAETIRKDLDILNLKVMHIEQAVSNMTTAMLEAKELIVSINKMVYEGEEPKEEPKESIDEPKEPEPQMFIPKKNKKEKNKY